MGFFFSKPKVSKYELQKVRSRLYSEGFSQRDLAEFDKVFSSALASNEGVDIKELENTIRWLREHPSQTTLSPEQVGKLESAMKKRI
jgi:hypothetical protein